MGRFPNGVGGFLYQASYGGVCMDVISSKVSHGRAVVEHTFPKRDGAATEDMGRDAFRCQLAFAFFDHSFATEDEGDYQQRFEAFNRLVDDGSVRVLVHPYEGAVQCRVIDFEHDADGSSTPFINCSASFVEEISVPPVFAPGAGAQTRVGSQDVEAEQLATDAALSDAGSSSTITTEAVTTALEWESNLELTAREVQLEMATLNNRLNSELDALEVRTNLTRHPIMRAYTRLQYSLRRAAESFTTTTTRIVKLTVTEALPLRVIAARFYGADQAERRFKELLELNRGLRDPLLVPRDTELKAYSPNTESQQFRR